jgi:hypothetical protein
VRAFERAVRKGPSPQYQTLHTRTHAHTNTHTHTHTHAHTRTHKQARTHTYAHTNRHARTHARTLTHTSAYSTRQTFPPVLRTSEQLIFIIILIIRTKTMRAMPDNALRAYLRAHHKLLNHGSSSRTSHLPLLGLLGVNRHFLLLNKTLQTLFLLFGLFELIQARL